MIALSLDMNNNKVFSGQCMVIVHFFGVSLIFIAFWYWSGTLSLFLVFQKVRSLKGKIKLS